MHEIYMLAADGPSTCTKATDMKGLNATHFANWIGVDQCAELRVCGCSFVCACFVVCFVVGTHTHWLVLSLMSHPFLCLLWLVAVQRSQPRKPSLDLQFGDEDIVESTEVHAGKSG